MKVTDVNDNSPIFDPAFYEVSVSEVTTMDELLENVNATDADQGTNGDITYAIVGGNDGNAFYIKTPSVRELGRNCPDVLAWPLGLYTQMFTSLV